MRDDTDIGGPGGRFPTTRLSAIVGASGDDAERRRSLDALVAAYWRPVYKHLRLKWRASNEDAKDLTQAFFARAIEKDFFAGYEPERARFRTFLRTCLDRFVANEQKAERRLKRGGGAGLLSLDFESAEGELARAEPVSPGSIDRIFDDEWCRCLLSLAVEALRARCEASGATVELTVFERYDLCEDPAERPTYEALATELGLPVTTITNRLASARKNLRRIVLEKLEEITATREELRSEAKALFGVDVE